MVGGVEKGGNNTVTTSFSLHCLHPTPFRQGQATRWLGGGTVSAAMEPLHPSLAHFLLLSPGHKAVRLRDSPSPSWAKERRFLHSLLLPFRTKQKWDLGPLGGFLPAASRLQVVCLTAPTWNQAISISTGKCPHPRLQSLNSQCLYSISFQVTDLSLCRGPQTF